MQQSKVEELETLLSTLRSQASQAQAAAHTSDDTELRATVTRRFLCSQRQPY